MLSAVELLGALSGLLVALAIEALSFAWAAAALAIFSSCLLRSAARRCSRIACRRARALPHEPHAMGCTSECECCNLYHGGRTVATISFANLVAFLGALAFALAFAVSHDRSERVLRQLSWLFSRHGLRRSHPQAFDREDGEERFEGGRPGFFFTGLGDTRLPMVGRRRDLMSPRPTWTRLFSFSLDMPISSDAAYRAKERMAACSAGLIWMPQKFIGLECLYL